MSNDAKKTVDAIANKKLGDLGVSTPIEGVEDLFGDPDAQYERGDKWVISDKPQPKGKIRKTKVVRKSAPKQATPLWKWEEQWPASKTPSVLSWDKANQKLLMCKELPWPDGEYASYEPKDKDKLVGVLHDHLLDVFEGAGLYVKTGREKAKMMERLWRIITDHFYHKDPHDQKHRVIREKK